MNICDAVQLVSGTPQFRIAEDSRLDAPVYRFYTQVDLENDLCGLSGSDEMRKQIRTSDAVSTTLTGDVVFSLLSGTAAVVQASHVGYLLTQNYVTLIPDTSIESTYLVYLLNEDRQIRRQLRQGQQGSATMKFTLKQISSLVLPKLPSLEKQASIGELYLNQLRLNALRKRASELETRLVLAAIREMDWS